MVFPVVTYGCERWTVKKSECQRIDAFELWCWRRCLKVPWTARRSNLSILREINPEYSLERHAEAEAPAFWSSYENSQLIGRVPDAGKDWGQKEKRASEDEMAGWHHQCNGHELGQTLGDEEGRGGLACYSPWDHQESDMTGWLNNNKVAKISNQSILKEINHEHSLERLTLKLKLQYFGNLMQRADSLEKTLMLGKTEGRRRRGWQRMKWLDSTIDSIDMSLSKLQEIVKDREAWRAVVHEITKSLTWLSN